MSPHVLDIRERCIIDGQLIEEALFVQYMNTIQHVIDTTDWSGV
jgi:folylpolyglutamate synthase/dihydropteroate synthase